VTEQGVKAADIHMLDQSHAQLSKARVKPELQDVATITVGDAENLPTNWYAIAYCFAIIPVAIYLRFFCECHLLLFIAA